MELWSTKRTENYRQQKERHAKNSSKWAKENPFKVQASLFQVKTKKRFPDIFATKEIETKDLASWLEEKIGLPCPYCTEPSSVINHKIPLSSGGQHTWDNLQLICSTCSILKKDLSEKQLLIKIETIFQNLRNLLG